MSMLVVGSLAFDTIETPHGRKEKVLGGSATHFSYSASYLTDVALVGVVGKDFPSEHIALYKDKGIDISGIELSSGDTFNWTGKYEGDMNEAETIEVNLNVLEDFQPKLNEEHLKRKWVFLANGDPKTQISVAEQMSDAKFIVADTMNLWIQIMRGELETLFRKINGVVMNDAEARMFTGEESIVAAAKKMLSYGLDLIIVKKGEHGALAMTPEYSVVIPAYPTEKVIDPTGAGDSFAGGTFGYLALCDELNPGTLRKALRYGTICASFQVEGFGLERHLEITRSDIERRLIAFEAML